MIDTVQAVLLFVIVLLTILLLVLGVQVFFILRELRTTINRANKILENTQHITESVSEPFTFISGLLTGSRSLSSIANVIKALRGKDREEKHHG